MVWYDERVKEVREEKEKRGVSTSASEEGRKKSMETGLCGNLQFYDCHCAPLHYGRMRGRKPGDWRGRRGVIRCGDGLGLEGYHTEIQEKTTFCVYLFFHDHPTRGRQTRSSRPHRPKEEEGEGEDKDGDRDENMSE